MRDKIKEKIVNNGAKYTIYCPLKTFSCTFRSVHENKGMDV